MPSEERLVAVSLALEDAVRREAWDEADDLFAARESLYLSMPPLAAPPEVDDIDLRILGRLRDGLTEVRRETFALDRARRAAGAYRCADDRTTRLAA